MEDELLYNNKSQILQLLSSMHCIPIWTSPPAFCASKHNNSFVLCFFAVFSNFIMCFILLAISIYFKLYLDPTLTESKTENCLNRALKNYLPKINSCQSSSKYHQIKVRTNVLVSAPWVINKPELMLHQCREGSCLCQVKEAAYPLPWFSSWATHHHFVSPTKVE